MPPAGSHFSVAEKMMMSRIATQYDGTLIPVIASIDTMRSMKRPRISAASVPSVSPRLCWSAARSAAVASWASRPASGSPGSTLIRKKTTTDTPSSVGIAMPRRPRSISVIGLALHPDGAEVAPPRLGLHPAAHLRRKHAQVQVVDDGGDRRLADHRPLELGEYFVLLRLVE